MYYSSFLSSDSPYILLICSPLYSDTDIAGVITTMEMLREKIKETIQNSFPVTKS